MQIFSINFIKTSIYLPGNDVAKTLSWTYYRDVITAPEYSRISLVNDTFTIFPTPSGKALGNILIQMEYPHKQVFGFEFAGSVG